MGTIASDSSSKSFVSSTFGSTTYSGVLTPQVYRLWDESKNQACVCDPGYSGIDCSYRVCPVGDDPLTWDDSSCGGSACVSEVQSFSIDGNQASASYTLTFTNLNGAVYTTNSFSLSSTNPTSASLSSNAAAIVSALSSLPNNVTGTVSVLCSGGASSSGSVTSSEASKAQMRCSVTFSTKSGNIPSMSISPVGSAGRSYLFQPGTPVQTLKFPTATNGQSYMMRFRIFPTDTTLFPQTGSASAYTYKHWTSAASDAFVYDATFLTGSAIAKALNTIPAIAFAYPGYFVGDSNVVVVTGTSNDYVVRINFPDMLTGSIPMSVQFQPATPTPNFDALPSTSWLTTGWASSLGDTVNGNREAVSCSNRGICDFSSGLCQCFAGQTGEDCSQQSALARGPSGTTAR